MSILSNSAEADFATLATVAATDAASNLTGAKVRLRDMSRNMMLQALAPGAKQLDGIITDIKVAIGWDKPNKWTSAAGNAGKARQLTAIELEEVKKNFAPCFSHVKFFVGEYSATEIAADVADIRTALESGEMALSTAYKAVTTARKEAAKVAAEAEAKAAKELAEAEALANVPPRDAEAEARDAALTAEADAEAELLAAMNHVAELLAKCAVPLSADVVAAMELVDFAMQDAVDRNNALAAEVAELEAVAA